MIKSRKTLVLFTNSLFLMLKFLLVLSNFFVLVLQNSPEEKRKRKDFDENEIRLIDFTTKRRPSTISRSIRRFASNASFFAKNVTKPKPFDPRSL